MNGKKLNHCKIMVVFAVIRKEVFFDDYNQINYKEIIEMQENELKYYSKLENWSFSEIKYLKEIKTNWNYYEEINRNTNKMSLCLDLGTGGGENVLKKYPDVRMIIATDFSAEMIKTARKNAKL